MFLHKSFRRKVGGMSNVELTASCAFIYMITLMMRSKLPAKNSKAENWTRKPEDVQMSKRDFWKEE